MNAPTPIAWMAAEREELLARAEAAARAVAAEVARHEAACAAVEAAQDEVDDALERLEERILATPARTLADLATKAECIGRESKMCDEIEPHHVAGLLADILHLHEDRLTPHGGTSSLAAHCVMRD